MLVDTHKKLIVLFDFQKTYHDNVVQDYSKIYQDFFLKWTARKIFGPNKTRADIIYDHLVPNSAWDKIDSKLFFAIKKEIFITLLRILPYIHDKDNLTLNWTKSNFEKIIKL